MGTKKEIVKAVKTVTEAGNKRILLLHCVSMYPTNHKKFKFKKQLSGLKKILNI